MKPPGTHYLLLSPRNTWFWYWAKALWYYLFNTISVPLSPSNSHFPPLSFPSTLTVSPSLSLSLGRASIVQKRIIYFQDEGSLTIRLCEKGNDSCPSCFLAFPLFIFSPLTTYHRSINSCSFCHFLFQEHLPGFHIMFKKTWSQKARGRVMDLSGVCCGI